jgi:acyl-CoA synthetase (NDP forming)
MSRVADYYADRAKRTRGAVERISLERTTFTFSRFMLEPRAMAWLCEQGIPVPEFRHTDVEADVTNACREIGDPVAMKIVSPDILHKSDCGGVFLDIEDDEAALAAFQALQKVASGKDFRGVVIYPMVRDAQELLVGLSRDPQFGPVLALGHGGVFTELWQDISLRVLPVDRDELGAMIRELRSFPLLQGMRGQSSCDLDALVDLLERVCQLPPLYPELAELDLNPVFLFSDGLVVGDVRVIFDGETKER